MSQWANVTPEVSLTLDVAGCLACGARVAEPGKGVAVLNGESSIDPESDSLDAAVIAGCSGLSQYQLLLNRRNKEGGNEPIKSAEIDTQIDEITTYFVRLRIDRT